MKLLLTLVLSISVLTFCLCQPNVPRDHGHVNSAAVQRARKYVDSLYTVQNIPGLSVAVGNKSGILWSEGFGFADLEAKVPVSVYSKFRLGSVSKSLTSMALGVLFQQEKLDLDAPIKANAPYFPVKNEFITARQLATHTSGIRHYRPSDPLSCPKRYVSVQDALSIFDQDTLLFPPGSNYQYSTYGYTLLSAVLEGASGKYFLSLLKTEVFSPLGMVDTSPDYSDSVVANRVRFYELADGKPINAALVDNSYKWAGGGLLSTPSDLVKLGTELMKCAILKKETVTTLLRPQLLTNGSSTNYAAGWRVDRDKAGRKILHHGGLIDGGRAFLIIYPDNDLVIAMTANISGARINLHEMDRIAGYFLNLTR